MAEAIQLRLQVNGMPASETLMRAVRRVDVTQNENPPTVFQIQLQGTPRVDKDYHGLSLLKAEDRVLVSVCIDGTSHALVFGIVTHVQFAVQGGVPMVTVSGEDITRLMAMSVPSVPWPEMSDSAIVLAILAKYLPYGLVPLVTPTTATVNTADGDIVTQQLVDDKTMLEDLAERHGYVFHLFWGEAEPVAYWGPPFRPFIPQKPLTHAIGGPGDVTSFDVSFDASGGSMFFGSAELPGDEPTYAPVVLVAPLFVPLSRDPAWLHVPKRKQLKYFAGDDMARAMMSAQGEVNDSYRHVVSLQAQVDGREYRSALQAPGVVTIRGIGEQNDGQYYLQSVTHTISGEGYTQSMQASRAGHGSLFNTVEV